MTRRYVTRRKLLAGLLVTGPTAVLVVACGGQAPPATPTQAPAPAAAATSAPAAAPPAPAKTSGEITFWSPNQPWNDLLQQEFAAAQPQIKLQTVIGEWNEPTKHLAAIAAGNPPSISLTGRHLTAEMAVRGALIAVDDYVKTATTFKWENIWTRLQKDAVTWGKKWLVPYTTDTRALFTNKEVFADAGLDPEKPPVTWQEVENYSAKILKKDSAGRITRIGFTPTFGNPPTYLWFYSMLWCMGSDLLSDDYTKVRVMEKGPDAMAYLKKLMDNQGGYETASAFTKALTPGQGLDAFSIGSVGMAMNTNSTPGNYDKYSPNLKYGLSKGPVFPEVNEPANYDGGGGLFFFKKGKNFDAAWTLAQFMMDRPFYLKFANEFNSLPARSDVGAEWAKSDPRREIFSATANTVHWIPIIAGTMGILTYMSTMFDNVMFGKEPIEKALPAFAVQVQTTVDQFNSFAPPA